jgi:transposase InsO family protein
VYYEVAPTPPQDLELMRLIDEEYTRHPFYGSRQLKDQGHEVNRKRVQRLMRLMGLEGIVPRPSTSRPHLAHKIYPYEDLVDAREHLRRYFAFYNDERPHRALGGLAPSAAYYASLEEQHGFARAA